MPFHLAPDLSSHDVTVMLSIFYNSITFGDRAKVPVEHE